MEIPGTTVRCDSQPSAAAETFVAAKPLVSLVVPGYNEASIVGKNLGELCHQMELLEHEYRWEMVIVNDGSTDGTGALAEAFARTKNNVHVLHHSKNFGLGQAFRTAFKYCRGDYIVTLDMDLSYSPDHIAKLLSAITQTNVKIVVVSPYMDGGKISNVPWLRRQLSIWANRFLSLASKGRLSTLTGMVRAYDGNFLRSLNLKATGMEINPEIVYKATLLGAELQEIPGHLDWHFAKTKGDKRRSSMRLLRHTLSVLLSGFLFRPVMFFLIPGFGLLLFAFYVNGWMLVHFFNHYQSLGQYDWFFSRASAAVSAAYNEFPHTFIVGGLATMLAIQLISLGILALQSKSYFEEIFYLGTNLYKAMNEKGREVDE
ncbi:MAG TPA: glycosyltransferase family 2 protein [Candidatus Binatia bacterium]|nr:glycosyltransferase family 2 protein [Candidatus Binatia bacterium]